MHYSRRFFIVLLGRSERKKKNFRARYARGLVIKKRLAPENQKTNSCRYLLLKMLPRGSIEKFDRWGPEHRDQS